MRVLIALWVSITAAPNTAVSPPSMTSAAIAPGLDWTSSALAIKQHAARIDDPGVKQGRNRSGGLHHLGQPAMQREGCSLERRGGDDRGKRECAS